MSSVAIENLHGAVTRVPVAATAVPHRSEGYDFPCNQSMARSGHHKRQCGVGAEAFAAMQPFTAKQLRYVNYLDEDDMRGDPARVAYGPNYKRLVHIKDTYDPHNLFHMNANIRPSQH